jgi:hypothetical protein
MTRPPWEVEPEESDDVTYLLGIALVIVISVFCAFSLGLVYQMAGPWMAEAITKLWEILK